MTLGRHLDNDVLLAGEDVLDYHVRIEMTDRGPRAIPLGEASIRVNGRDLAAAVGLMPGDALVIGQSAVAVEAELVDGPEADAWHLHNSVAGERWAVLTRLGVGRDTDNELQVEDDHVSRRHARFSNFRGLIWLQDLGSSNGTYVNGERLSGACRLFHGDEVRFDTLTYQLIGHGADLTPVREREPDSPAMPVLSGRTEGESDTTEFAVVDGGPQPVLVDLPERTEAGAFLLGASEPVTGMTYRTPMGRSLIGRHEECDVVIRDRTVSARHAELMVRAEGVTLTNLMATNGTRVNGAEVQTLRLHDGDVLRLGRVNLVFKDVPPTLAGRPWLQRTQLALLVGSLILALGLAALLL